MTRAAPLRSLALALGGWLALRTAMLWPDPPRPAPDLRPPAAAAPTMSTGPAFSASALVHAATPSPEGRSDTAGRFERGRVARPDAPAAPSAPALATAAAVAAPLRPLQAMTESAPPMPSLAPFATAAPASPPAPRRWSGSAWLLARGQDRAALAPAGTLGGSQAGGRIWYRIGHGLALSARLYLPLRQPRAGDVAAGLDWQPLPALPVHLLAERRQAIGRDGRSAFSLTAYGGLNRPLTRRLRLDAYAQAGIVGLRERDLFVDGSARLSTSLGPIEIGAGVWGAAQPDLARLDAGPSLAWRLPVRRASLRLQADWRVRLAGDAAPGSGPALTLTMDF